MRYEPLSLDVATSQFEISDIPKNHTLDFSLMVCCEPLMYGNNKNNVRIFEAENSEHLENSKNTEPEVDFRVFL